MIDVLGISNWWEVRIRATKSCIRKALGGEPVFTCVYVSEDVAEDIKLHTKIIGTVGVDTTFEGTPLKVDKTLPIKSVIYIWNKGNTND